jgi:hypothetical protein
MKLSIAKWQNNHKAPAVLMIDDLNDIYLELYRDSFKNDWGYLCNNEGSAYNFLQKELLNKFPKIKITFFTPYAKHNVINPNGAKFKRYGVGEREEFSNFLQYLQNLGHEIAHHGSNHGKYRDINNPSTQNGNFIHEWELFDSVDEGVEVTLKGVELFKNIGINVSGGKFCGYKSRENSLEIIDKCNFLYWCANSGVNEIKRFGKNRVIKFPTTFAGNSFVRLSYKTGNFKKDFIKLFTRFLQPIYNKKEYKKLNSLYENGNILAIQEHISPSTSSGLVQSANIISDIKSLNKIFKFLETKDIWYATCHEISSYIELKDNTLLAFNNNELILTLNSNSKVESGTISLVLEKNLKLKDSSGKIIAAIKKDKNYIINLPIKIGKNNFEVVK